MKPISGSITIYKIEIYGSQQDKSEKTHESLTKVEKESIVRLRIEKMLVGTYNRTWGGLKERSTR